jgi:hypothetical protein
MPQKVADGIYRGRAIQQQLEGGEMVWVQFGKSKRKRSQQALVMFEITSDGPGKGHVLPWFGYFSKDSAERTVESFRLMGWSGTSLASLREEPLDNEVDLQVENNDFENKRQSRVAWVGKGAPVIRLDSLGAKDMESLERTLARFIDDGPGS